MPTWVKPVNSEQLQAPLARSAALARGARGGAAVATAHAESADEPHAPMFPRPATRVKGAPRRARRPRGETRRRGELAAAPASGGSRFLRREEGR